MRALHPRRCRLALLALLGLSATAHPAAMKCDDPRFAVANTDTIMGSAKAPCGKAGPACPTIAIQSTSTPAATLVEYVPGQALQVSIGNFAAGAPNQFAIHTSLGSFANLPDGMKATCATTAATTADLKAGSSFVVPLASPPCGSPTADLSVTVIWSTGAGAPVSYHVVTVPRSKRFDCAVDLAVVAPSLALPGAFAWGISADGKSLRTQLQVGRAVGETTPPWIGWGVSSSGMMVPATGTVSSAVIYRPGATAPIRGYALVKAAHSTDDAVRLAGVVPFDDAGQVGDAAHAYDDATKMTTLTSTLPLALNGTANGTKHALTQVDPKGSNTVLFAYGSNFTAGAAKPDFAHHTHVASAVITWQPAPAPTPPPTPEACTCCDKSCSAPLPGDGPGTLTWQINEKAGTTSVHLTATQAGYLAFGFGKSSMGSASDPSYVYIGGKGAASAAATPFKITGFNAAAVVPAKPADFPMKVTDVSFAQTVGAADDKATTTLVLTVRTADIAGYNTMYAVGTGNGWKQHQFAKSTVLDYRHGTTAAPSSVSNQALIVAHGALMLVAWGLCIPLGVLAARFKDQVGKPLWFKAHRAVQTLGLLAMVAGFALIVSFVNKNGTAHWGGTHGKVGLTVVVLGLCQPLNAFIRPPAGSVTMARQAWEFVHKKVGYALVVAAWYNIVLGTDLGIMSASSGLSDAASGLKVAADFFFVIVVFAGLYLQQREMRHVAVGDGDEKLLG